MNEFDFQCAGKLPESEEVSTKMFCSMAHTAWHTDYGAVFSFP